MLHIEPGKTYTVYPSWAEGQMRAILNPDRLYSWKDLPAVLSDPERSGLLETSDFDFLQMEPDTYPRPIQPFTCLDGPWGGGIIVVQRSCGERWLPELALKSIADFCYPGIMSWWISDYCLPVGYLEPLNIPLGRLFGIKPPKLYIPRVTVEHTEQAGDDVYVLLLSKPSKQVLPGLSELPAGFLPFGLELIPVQEAAPALQAQIAQWCVNMQEATQHWFTLTGDAPGIGYLFAVMLYVTFHLRKVAGVRLKSAHLLANIEGKPNYMYRWGGNKVSGSK